jgi:hypothetical protein
MIQHKTFYRKTGISHKSIQEEHESIRCELERFVANELSEDQIISITESAVLIPLGMSSTVVSTTVWYNDEQGG